MRELRASFICNSCGEWVHYSFTQNWEDKYVYQMSAPCVCGVVHRITCCVSIEVRELTDLKKLKGFQL